MRRPGRGPLATAGRTAARRAVGALPARRAVGAVAVLAALTLVVACGTPASTDAPPGASAPQRAEPGTRSADALSGTLTVLAAASLTETFTDLADRFEEHHPGLDVRLSFGGSSTLAQQVLAGAPADVLATANRPTMATVTDARAHAAPPEVLARNALALAVPAGNPAGVTALTDLDRPGVTFAVCAVEVPCGMAAATLLTADGVTATPVTYERDVRGVLTKVRMGEVDAGLVYRTDVAAAGDDVVGIPLPQADDTADDTPDDPAEDAPVVTDYLVAPLAEAPNPDAAAAFVAFVLGEDGRGVLAAAGFVLP